MEGCTGIVGSFGSAHPQRASLHIEIVDGAYRLLRERDASRAFLRA